MNFLTSAEIASAIEVAEQYENISIEKLLLELADPKKGWWKHYSVHWAYCAAHVICTKEESKKKLGL